MALAIQSDARVQTNLFKCAISLVVIKKFGHGVVGDKKVNVAIAVVIRESNAQTLAWRREAHFSRDFREVPITIVVIYQGAQSAWK